MDRINKLLDPNTPINQLEDIMRDLLKDKFDQELKDHYKLILKEKYHYHKNENLNPKTNSYKIYAPKYVLLALLIGALFFVIKNISNTNSKIENDSIVHQYLVENTFYYNDNYRGNLENRIDQNRALGFSNTNARNYEKALNHFELISTKTIEDKFFIAYCKLNLLRSEEAFSDFKLIQPSISASDKYYHELRLYTAFSLFSLNNIDELNSYTHTWDKNSWEYIELNKIMN